MGQLIIGIFGDGSFNGRLPKIEQQHRPRPGRRQPRQPHQRQFSDEQLRAIFQRDGVVGAALDAWMLEPGWVRGESTNERVTLNAVVDHIDHVCQLAGTSRHAGIGSDLDGGFGGPQSPNDLDTIADLQKLPGLLTKRGYSEADIAAVMHGNWLRLLGQSLWARS